MINYNYSSNGFESELSKITKVRELAKELAVLTIELKVKIDKKLCSKSSNIYFQLLQAYEESSLVNLTLTEFSDELAQTLALIHFSISLIPINFLTIQESDNSFIKLLKETIECNDSIEELTHFNDLFTKVDLDLIKQDFSSERGNNDPIIHFYEEFLYNYNSQMKLERGVFYTSDPIVKFIVESIHNIFEKKFLKVDGITNKDIQIIDPAMGTGTFLIQVIAVIYKEFNKKYENFAEDERNKIWNTFVQNNLLPRIQGFELLMTPYMIAQLKINWLLRKLSTTYLSEQEARIYLVNPLEGKYKYYDKSFPITVILGNPPYSKESYNKNDWIDGLLRGEVDDGTRKVNYFKVNGKPIGEKNPKWLNDDYVKFIRYSQWRIEKTGSGVLAFITNHGYLDNPTFRGLRFELMQTFDELYFIDFHGNIRKNEQCPDGSKDENVFDIQQGVAICFLIKYPNKTNDTKIFRSEVWGKRKKKYEFLQHNTFQTINWEKIEPFAPWYYFFKIDEKKWIKYSEGWKITEIFKYNSVGIVTGRDKLTIQYTQEDVWRTVRDFALIPVEEARMKYNLGKDTQEWKVEKAQEDLLQSGISLDLSAEQEKQLKEKYIIPILYRPFDIRYTYYTSRSRGFICRPRKEIMHNLIKKDNLAILTTRMTKGERFHHIQVSREATEVIVMSSKTSNNAFVFPLNIYDEGEKNNYSEGFLGFISKKWTFKFSNEDIFYYLVAILHSKNYSSYNNEFLNLDFPRIPFTDNEELTKKLIKIGDRLTKAHLMENITIQEELEQVKYIHKGNHRIERIKFNKNRIYINRESYITNITQEVFEYVLGGYQVCKKWLKGRKGRNFTEKDILHFKEVIFSIRKIIHLNGEVDSAVSQGEDFTFSKLI